MRDAEQLDALRKEIDAVDADMLRLLERRVALSEKIANFKRAHGMGVLDEARERQVLEAAAARVDSALKDEASLLMETLMAISKRRQQALLNRPEPRQ